MRIFLYSVALECSCFLSDTALQFSWYLQLCISEFRSVKLTVKLTSLALIRYKKSILPKPYDQDMSIFLYSFALYCSCLLSDIALRFSLYLKVFISELKYFDFTIKLTALALIRYKKSKIPKPDDQDISIFLYSVALHCSCLLSYTALHLLCISSCASRNSDIFISQ